MTNQTLDYAQQRPRSRERFRPTWWAIASIAPLVAVAFVFLLPEPISECLGVVVLAALVATVIYLLSGRRALAANLAFAILVGTLTIVFAVAAWLTSSLHADRIVIDAEVDFARRMKLTADVQNDFINAGAISATNLDHPGELDHRIALLNQLRAQMTEALKAGDNAADDLSRDLQAARVLPWHRPRAIRKFDRDTHWSYYAATVHVTLSFHDACADLLSYLRDHKAEWSITPGTNTIEFRSLAGKAHMDALRQAIQKAAADVQGAPLKAAQHPSTTRATTQMTTQPTTQSATSPRSRASDPSARDTSRSGRVADPRFPMCDRALPQKLTADTQS